MIENNIYCNGYTFKFATKEALLELLNESKNIEPEYVWPLKIILDILEPNINYSPTTLTCEIVNSVLNYTKDSVILRQEIYRRIPEIISKIVVDENFNFYVKSFFNYSYNRLNDPT